MTPRPNQAYYQRNFGGWEGTFTFAITDWTTFRGAGMSLLDRWSVLATVYAPRFVGPLRVETQVDLRPDREAPDTMLHRLRISKWGLTLYRTDEVFTLEEDGLAVTIRAVERRFPLLWRGRDWPVCHGAVEEAADAARYDIPWFGTTLEIRARLTADGVDVAMATPWAAGVQHLSHKPA